MSTLTGTKIKDTYPGLIKTDDNGVVGATEKQLTDGLGNPLPITAGTSGISFTGDVDFTSATVTGLPSGTSGTSGVDGATGPTGPAGTSGTSGIDGVGVPTGGTAGQALVKIDGTDYNTTWTTISAGGAAGLVTNGANGMKSDASLTTNPALSTGTNSIVLGDNARDEGNSNAISIGLNARVRQDGGIAIGRNTEVYEQSIAIGNGAVAVYPGISIGEGAKNFGAGNAVVIGYSNNTDYSANIINIGGQTNTGSDNIDNIILGSTVTVAGGNAQRNIYIGNDTSASTAGVDDNILIGHGASTVGVSGVTVLGTGASATATEAVALGKDVVAATAYTVTLKRLQMLDYASLNFASDAAAATGGIPLGGVYHTEGILKIRIA